MRTLRAFLMDHPMSQHPLLDSLAVAGVSAVALLTSEKTLIFMGICFTALRMWLAWRKRNHFKDTE